MIEEDKGETTSNYVLMPLIESAPKFQIVWLNAESNNEKVISVSNDVVTEGNTLMSDGDIDMLVVLPISSKFMEFMRSKYGNLYR